MKESQPRKGLNLPGSKTDTSKYPENENHLREEFRDAIGRDAGEKRREERLGVKEGYGEQENECPTEDRPK